MLNASVSRLHRVLFTFNGVCFAGTIFLDVIRTRSGRGRLCDRALKDKCALLDASYVTKKGKNDQFNMYLLMLLQTAMTDQDRKDRVATP